MLSRRRYLARTDRGCIRLVSVCFVAGGTYMKRYFNHSRTGPTICDNRSCDATSRSRG